MEGGKQVQAGAAIDDYYPAIMDRQHFDLAQAKIQARKKSGSGRKGSGFSNIFTRLIKCTSCGGNIRYIDKGTSKKGGKYLICNNSYNHNECDAPAWRYTDFEQDFIQEVIEIPIDELLTNPNDPHQRTSLINRITGLRKSLSDLEEEHAEARKLMRNAKREGNTLRAKGYDDDLTDIESQIGRNNSDVETAERELAALESRLKKRTQKELVALYDEMKSTSTESELASVRRKMNALIRSVVDRIVITNNFNHIPVWEMLDASIPDNVIKSLHDKGYKTQAEIESFFCSDYGRRIFNESLREFRIYFKGGAVRVCIPSRKGSYRMERKLKTFINNKKKRSSEQARKYKKKSKVQFELGRSISDILNQYHDEDSHEELQEYMNGLSERERDALSYFNEATPEPK